MKEIYQSTPLEDNRLNNRFELHINDYIAFIEYQVKGSNVHLIHTEVPSQLEGLGVGTAIVEKVFQFAESKQLKVVPACSFISSYLTRHPEWNALVSAG